MIMLVAENAESKVIRVGNMNEVIVAEESVRSYRPSGLRFCEVGGV
jgi:hypothetical protein